MKPKVIFLPLGGIGEVTKNMYLYESGEDIIIVDCGLGFPDETMIGVDLLIPDISYLLGRKNKIRGMILTHAHEDHIGGLPYILPQLPPFPIFGTPLTAVFANEKLEEFGLPQRVKTVSFKDHLSLGSFLVSFVHVTHSVPDSANLVIKSPLGVFYHASDFKFDQTPVDGFPTEIEKIKAVGEAGVHCLLIDSLRVEKEGRTPSERDIEESFEREIKNTRGKFIVTTYSSNVSRLNQALNVARKFNRKVCFIGRSLERAKEVAENFGYLKNLKGLEIKPSELRHFRDDQLLFLVAGSQGQENSALVRIANNDDKFIKIREGDSVVFSADPIPGNEVAINSLIDTLSQKGAKVFYSAITDDLHVSGHAAKEDIIQMIKLVKPKFIVPISAAYRQMVGLRELAQTLGFKKENIILPENGQEIIFEKEKAYPKEKVHLKNVYVDQISGEEIEEFVLRDRQKLAQDGVIVALVSIDREKGELVGKINFIARGFITSSKSLFNFLEQDVKKTLARHRGRVTDLPFTRNLLSEHLERLILKKTTRRPLVLPIVIEV